MLKVILICLCKLPSHNPFKQKVSIITQRNWEAIVTASVKIKFPGKLEKKVL